MMYTKRSQREREGKKAKRCGHKWINSPPCAPEATQDKRCCSSTSGCGSTRSSGNNSQDKECRRFMAQTCHAAGQDGAGGGRAGQSNPTRFEGRRVWASVSAATNQCKDFFTINCVIESFRRRRSTQQRRGQGLQGGCTWQQGRGRGKFN